MPSGYDYYALRNLYIGYALAFSVGQLVPDATVASQGYVTGTDVNPISTPPPTSQTLVYVGTPTDGQYVAWQASSGTWVPLTGSGGGSGIPMIRPEDHGAVANGTTDDSLAFYAAIQAGLAQASGAGCYIQLQQGRKYYIGKAANSAHSLNGLIDLSTGVYMGVPGGSGRANTGATTLIGDSTFTGYIIDTVTGGVQGCGLNGILVESDMSGGISNPIGGIRFQVVEWGHIRDVGVGNVSDVALNVYGCIDLHLENLSLGHNITGRTLTDVTPTFFLSGTDHVLINIEANGGNTGTTIGTGLTGTSFRNPAIQMWGALTCKFWGVNGEFADVGWYLGGTSSVTGGAASTFVSLNQFNDTRGDYNAAHGYYVNGAAWNQFHSTTVYNNSNNASGSYDGVFLVNTATNLGNRFTTIMGGSPSGAANIMGYYYHDAATGGVSQMNANVVNTIGGEAQGMAYDFATSGLPYRFAVMRGNGIGAYQYRLASRYCVGETWADIINTTAGVPTVSYSDGASSTGQGGWRLMSTGALTGNLLSPLTVECLGGSSAGWLALTVGSVTSGPPVTTATCGFAPVCFNTVPSIVQKLGNNQILAVTANAAAVTAGYAEVLTAAVISGIAASTSYAVAVQTVAGSAARNVKFIIDCFSGATFLSSVTTDTGATNSTTAVTTHAATVALPVSTNAIQVRVRFTGVASGEVHYVGLMSVDTHSTQTVPVYA